MTEQKTPIITNDALEIIARRVNRIIDGHPRAFIADIRSVDVMDPFGRPALRGTEAQRSIKQKLTEALIASIPQKNEGVNPTETAWLEQIELARKEFSTPPYNILELDWRPVVKYYDDLISGNILDRLHVTRIQKDGFIQYMKAAGKLGGQNKVPRLSNDRQLADALQSYIYS
jgi:hypothetical protein